MELKIGFTGTQGQMTSNQVLQVIRLLENLKPSEVHHGDCVGSDAFFHKLVRQTLPQTLIVIHPPFDPKKRAFCEGDLILEAKPYLERNHDIVNQTSALIATPKTQHEVLRSGTWATIRTAKKLNKNLYIVLP